jgi:serine/threonine protein kinase
MAKKTFFDGEWESIELLGKGTYGAVYKARKTNSEIEAISAIKEIHIPNDINDISTMRTEGMTKANIDEELVTELNNLKKEIKALYKFKDSINIVNIEDYKVEEIECDDEFHTKNYIVYIRMELLESINSMFLNESIKDKDVLKLGIDIATALEEMEEENFIHRDIKPENIFVNRHGVYKLGDFGEAKQLNKTISNVSIRGTEQYMAPELLGAKKIDKTVDIYSLGLVLYRFFNNKKFPFYPNDHLKQLYLFL